jgi:hypothetical protein
MNRIKLAVVGGKAEIFMGVRSSGFQMQEVSCLNNNQPQKKIFYLGVSESVSHLVGRKLNQFGDASKQFLNLDTSVSTVTAYELNDGAEITDFRVHTASCSKGIGDCFPPEKKLTEHEGENAGLTSVEV